MGLLAFLAVGRGLSDARDKRMKVEPHRRIKPRASRHPTASSAFSPRYRSVTATTAPSSSGGHDAVEAAAEVRRRRVHEGRRGLRVGWQCPRY